MHPPRKLILKNTYSPGDIVMMTAAVRDLHRCYPGRFLTDVRTLCPELWENNPYLTHLDEADPEVEVINCRYSLIDRCDTIPVHCLQALIDCLNERLNLRIQLTAFKGDVHLSLLEKSWFSQVFEWAGADLPFWIVVAGGKYDIPIKWWAIERFQAVVDYFRGRIQFVQVGNLGHHHPRLDGAIDLRGRTTLRELVRLVYHAQGVLCPVTALMHLAAAVETKPGEPALRPCVVVAGGREPVHWETYPGHQFLHTIGSLRCCARSGCWRDRVEPLGDGDERDRPERRCADVTFERLPRCMDLITPADVIRRIEGYFSAGTIPYLSPRQQPAAAKAVAALSTNEFDDQPLNQHTAPSACEHFARHLVEPADTGSGRGIVICAGGAQYFTNAWVCLQMLRRQGCTLPVELWHLGRKELDATMAALVRPLNVRCVDALEMRSRFPSRRLGGWPLKPYAMLYSAFREVLLLDADNVPVVDPEFLWETPEFAATGALFWPDFGQLKRSQYIWDNCGLVRPPEPEFESGQILIDKARCWRALRLALWFNEHSDFYYRHLYGDKETFHLAFCKLRQRYALVPHRLRALDYTMCQHDFAGNRIFQHRNTDKWNLDGSNPVVPGFLFEDECRQYLAQLARLWDGQLRPDAPASASAPVLEVA